MFLCQMSGIPGTGKSTLARRICKQTGSVLLDIDTVKSSIMNTFDYDIDFKQAGKAAYDVVFALADDCLAMGQSVVIDSPCSYTMIIQRGTALTKKHKASYKFIECYLKNIPEINRRRTTRTILPSQKYNTPIDENKYRESVDGLKRPDGNAYLLIDTGLAIEEYVALAVAYLEK